MKILGNRILVSKLEEPKTEGFQSVEVQDSFVYKGKVEQIGKLLEDRLTLKKMATGYMMEDVTLEANINIGDTVLFAKYSPDTQEIDHEGKKMKVVKVEDIIAVL